MLRLFILCFVALAGAEKSTEFDSGPQWHAKFSVSRLEMFMDTVEVVNLTITDLDTVTGGYTLRLRSGNPYLVSVDKVIDPNEVNHSMGSWTGSFNITGIFLGNTVIYVELVKANDVIEVSREKMSLVVMREMRIIDHIFTGSVALFVSLLYVNFGAALDLKVVKEIFLRPVGPAIGFFGQFIIMPLCSFALGYALFPDMVELHLGLFFAGVSPGGGASNLWTVMLQGNINLSITMTTISTLAAFGMMPFWIFTLGRLVFERGSLGVPYEKIAMFAVALIIPLFIGLGIQRFLPKIAKVLVRLLKPISIILIMFMVVFAIITNLYLFELFTWKIIVAGLGLPWLGYTLSWCIAKILRQSAADALTIAIETGIQNTGISIFLLRFTLPQPAADLTTVIPVSVAIMTQVPLLALYISQKIFKWSPKEKSPMSSIM